MSGTGAANGSAAATPTSLLQLLGAGEAAGSQAQFSAYLQLIARIVAVLETLIPSSSSPFTNYSWTGGNLDIASAFPTATTGTFSLSPASPGPITVTLPNSGGPWLIVDGSGFCSPANQITIESSGGVTVFGAAAYYFVQPRQSGIFVLDGANYNLF